MLAVSSDQATAIYRFYEQCLDQHQTGILPELFTPDVIAHTPNGDSTGLAALEQTVERVHVMFPDHRFVIEDVLIQGDKGAARWTMTATNSAPIAGVPPTGKTITQRANVMYRFEGNKIAEFWLQLDQVGMLRQLGVSIPGGPPAR